MGELADYLVDNDANFRKFVTLLSSRVDQITNIHCRARLPALYSDFRPQRTLNPDGYQANVSAWRQALATLTSQGLISHRGSNPDHLVLSLDDSLLRSLENKQFGQPLALGTVVREAAAEKDFIPLGDFTKSQQSIYQRTWSGVPWSVMSWTLRQLGVMDPSKGDDKIPKGQYVVVKNLEGAAKEFGDLTAEKSSRFDRIFTKMQFQKAFSTNLIKDQRLTDADLDVFLKFLSRDKGAIEYDGTTIRVKGGGEQSGITEEDASIASLKELMESLQHQTNLLNSRIEELSKTAKEAVARKNRLAALSALKSKKIAETSLSTRYATLNQLEEVAAKIERAADNVQLIKVMESSTGVLENLNKQVGGVEKVDGVMDRLREQMSATDEVGAILAESTGAIVDEGEIDDELEAMERQEREKEEAELRKKQEAEKKAREEQEAKEAEEAQKALDALPSVPNNGVPLREKEQTPTSETGIANLSVEEKPQEQEEPMLAS